MKIYLDPVYGDMIYTNQIPQNSTIYHNECSVEQYLAEIKAIADYVPPQPKFHGDITKYLNQVPVITEPVESRQQKIDKKLARFSSKRIRLMKMLYTPEEIEAIASATFLKGLRAAKRVKDEDLDKQIVIALEAVKETREEWDRYLNTLKNAKSN